jgi:hypothetical protein
MWVQVQREQERERTRHVSSIRGAGSRSTPGGPPPSSRQPPPGAPLQLPTHARIAVHRSPAWLV